MLKAYHVYIVCSGFLPGHFSLEFGQFFSQLTDSFQLGFLLGSGLLFLLHVTVLLLAYQLLQRKDKSKSQTRLWKNMKGKEIN